MILRTNNPRYDAAAAAPNDDRAWESRLDRAASSLYADVVPPASLQERVSAAVVVAPAIASPRRRVLLWSGVTVGACAAVSAVLLMTPGTPVNPTPAFAQVEAAMSSIKTAHWTETHTYYKDRNRPRILETDDMWVRLDPPALSIHTIPDNKQRRRPLGRLHSTHIVWDAKGTTTYLGEQNEYRHDPARPGERNAFSSSEMPRLLLNWVLIPSPLTPPSRDMISLPRHWRHMFARPGNGEQWQMSKTTLENRPALLFEYRPSTERELGKQLRPVISRYRVWADPGTRRVVRRDVVQVTTGTYPGIQYTFQNVYRTVATNFRYNEEPPPGTFEVNAPPDAKIRTLRAPSKGQAEQGKPRR